MAKTEKPEPTSSPSPPAKAAPAKAAPAKTPASPPAPPGPQLVGAYRALKFVGFVVGFPAAMLSTMALLGALTDNGFARVLGALGLLVVPPLVLADRLLPEEPKKAQGLVTDVLAVSWVLVAFVIAGAAGSVTRPMFSKEGDRLVRSGYPQLGKVTYLLGGVSADIPQALPEPSPSGAGSASAASSAASPADAGAAADTAAVDAGEIKDAGKAPSSGKAEKTPAEIFKDLAPAVVTIFVKAGMGQGGGTGFVVDKDGTIATNHHVIAGAGAVRIKFQNGAIYENVELLIDETATDLALLHIDFAAPLDGGARPDIVPIGLGDSEGIVVGEHAVAIGNPLGLEHTLTDGLVSSRRMYENKAWIQFSAPISPGNSGGPLFNMRGEVIGVTTATILGHGIAQNLNLAVPVNELKKLFRPVYPGRRRFGDGQAPSQW